MTTSTVPAAERQLFTVTVNEYNPLATRPTFAMVGFCALLVNPFGPVHEYVPPATAGVKRFSVSPAHLGPLLVADGAAGGFGSVRVIGPVIFEEQIPSVTLMSV